jgi:hypothetical protein
MSDRLCEINLSDIDLTDERYKISFSDNDIIFPAQSIKEAGLICPPLVRPVNNKFIIISGFNRIKAQVYNGLDNKMKYFKPLRIKLYKEIISCIKEYAPDLLVYFCMEDEEVWEKCMGFFPAKEGELGHMLDKSAVSHCDLNSSLL